MRFPRILTVVPVILLFTCDSVTGLFDDEPEHWAHTDVGYPFTAHLAQQDSVQLRSGEWVAQPNLPNLRSATQAAIERWSLALSATASRPFVWDSWGVGYYDDWGVLPLPGDIVSGFRVAIFFGSGAWGWHHQTRYDVDGRPIFGVIGLNVHVDDTFSAEWLETTIAHEIGHALGFHPPFDHGVIDRVNERAGVTVATRLPVDGAHWEECMRPDLMTASATARRGQLAHISDLTIETMAYPWRYNEADVEKNHGAPPACWRNPPSTTHH